MVKQCKICGNEFVLPKIRGGHNRLCCSNECSKKNNSILKQESRDRLDGIKYELRAKFASENRIPIRYVDQFGIKFLEDNKEVLGSLQEITRISGKYTYLTEEEKDIRRKASIRDANLKQRLSRGYKIKQCKICGTEFTLEGSSRGNTRVTCSDKCSTELHRIQSNQASQRRRDKLKKIK